MLITSDENLVVLGNASNESEEEEDSHEDVSMMAIKDVEIMFNSIFSLMEKFDDEDNHDEVTFYYLKSDLDTFSIKMLRELAIVLIDLTFDNLILNEKNECASKKTQLLTLQYLK